MGRLVKKYYGINDLGTQWEIKELIEEKIGNCEFERTIKNTIENPINSIEQYISNLNAKVTLKYRELIPNIISDENKNILLEFYDRVFGLTAIKDIDIKLIRYISKNIKEILSVDDKSLKSETLLFILENSGFKEWEIVVDDDDSAWYLGFNHFNETQSILKKFNKDLHYKFIRKILFPLKIHCGLERQLEIVKLMKNTYKDITDEYEAIVMAYLEGEEFNGFEWIQRQSIINILLYGKCFTSKNEIVLNNMLNEINIEGDKKIRDNGFKTTISSENYMGAIQHVHNFREKLFMLLYEQGFSWFHLMMLESEETSLIDLISYGNFKNNKYKNSTLMNISYIKLNVAVNTLALISNNASEFWDEIIKLISDVEDLSDISQFLSVDIGNVRWLMDNKQHFLATTYLSQIIERLLRELYFSIEYGVVGFLKSSNLTLGSLLKDNEEKNPLMKLFSKNEINALNFFLNDRDNGENTRNRVAHYIINADEVKNIDAMFLLDILLFILLKVYYQGIVLEKNDTDYNKCIEK